MDGRGGDTIAAHSSGRPPAAIAIIRVSGPAAHAVGIALGGELPVPRQAGLRSLRHPVSGDPLDSALVLRFDAPHSATGEDIVEFQVHGGRAVVAAVLGAVTSCRHVRLAEPGEFTRRALGNGRIDLTEAEGLADLLEAETESQRRAALALAGGALSRQIETWQAEVLTMSAQAEAAIDYVGDEDETAIDLDALVCGAATLAEDLRAWLARPRIETLKDGVRIVIAGPPNAGKSSLINALVGFDRAIVTPIAGTTRDSIEVPLAVSGVPMTLVDTAGLRETNDPVEAAGVERARAEAQAAEILLWLGDPADPPAHAHLVRIHPKSDLAGPASPVDLVISVKTGEGLPELVRLLSQAAENLLPRDGSGPSLNARQAQLIEQAERQLRALPSDVVLIAETFRAVRMAFDRLTGRAGVEDTIDLLFARFCLGK